MSDSFAQLLVEDVGREPLSMAVARQLRAAIVSGDLTQGTVLPSEKDLAARFGVGRSTLREALRVLQSQGLVTGGDNVSTKTPTVSGAGSVTSAASALENLVLLGQLSLTEMLSLRLLIERSALRSVAAGAADLSQAEAALEQMRRADGDLQLFHEADVAFHAALIDAAGNRAFTLVMRVLREAMQRHLLAALQDEKDPEPVLRRLIGEHEAIIEAVRAGEGDLAAERVCSHIEAFYEQHLDG
ncbi:FadR/GntR family transcriptional regulator [Nocardioides sp.]|uniref:FadR/GntR family transcriptional regulator n=1 Tax=Nocardioides sp. TaxID=35761 RepID=UPI0035666030